MWVGIGVKGHLAGVQHPPVGEGDGGLFFASRYVGVLLWQVHHHSQLLEGQAAQQWLARADRLPELNMTLGDNPAIGRNHAGVIQLLAGLLNGGLRPLNPGLRRIQIVAGGIEFLLGDQPPLSNGSDTLVLLGASCSPDRASSRPAWA